MLLLLLEVGVFFFVFFVFGSLVIDAFIDLFLLLLGRVLFCFYKENSMTLGNVSMRLGSTPRQVRSCV